jgi:hypothetical protein
LKYSSPVCPKVSGHPSKHFLEFCIFLYIKNKIKILKIYRNYIGKMTIKFKLVVPKILKSALKGARTLLDRQGLNISSLTKNCPYRVPLQGALTGARTLLDRQALKSALNSR